MSWTYHLAIDGESLYSFITHHTEYRLSGMTPVERVRKFINGHELASPNHPRVFRRWKHGCTVTKSSAAKVLGAYGLTLADFAEWCGYRDIPITVRGELPTDSN
jgi:hypothetical protein